MTTRVQKWGNSLAVRLPKEIADKFNLSKGSSVFVVPEKGGIVIKPIIFKKEYSLEELLKKITPKNKHKELGWGKAKGKEVW